MITWDSSKRIYNSAKLLVETRLLLKTRSRLITTVLSFIKTLQDLTNIYKNSSILVQNKETLFEVFLNILKIR